MGKSKAEEMDFWTGEEFRKFIDSVMNKRLSYMAFMTLYWTGMRLGELLALNPKDVDLEKENNFYHKIIPTSWKERCDHSAKDTEEQESDYRSRVSGCRYQKIIWTAYMIYRRTTGCFPLQNIIWSMKCREELKKVA